MVRRLRKTKKNQKYNYNCNRKRLGKKNRRNGHINDPEIRAAYDEKKKPANNIREMGLAYDVNRAIPIPNVKQQIKAMELELSGQKARPSRGNSSKEQPKQYVAARLEEDANEYAGSRFRMARSMVRVITDMIDRHGFNYKAMSLDWRNYEQVTWRQFRTKIRKFLRIPEQCTPYLEQKGWLDCDMNDPNDPRWKEYSTDDES
ncbi:nucleolar protein 16 [Anopheles merus]|uniref:Nucleolar protein 16 n=2 Tax=gambiae species complex TaxID=44542 RepID=Q7QA47_ANOGA|nr:nucleolar protein 16 [Anopheles merus]XP_041762155.1 nucleolar protein 16 [Anopheles merus]EAA09259.3 AGAP004441-PA [Anopheles gambiae str. PEST]